MDNDQLLQIPHKSFSNFLVDHDRSLAAMRDVMTSVGSGDLRSYVIDHEDSANLAIACLCLMNSTLKFNACRIPTSHCLNDEIPQLESLLSDNISPALVYACRFWAEHLKGASRDDVQLRAAAQPLLKTLLHEKVLYWLEILSLAKSIPLAEKSLQVAAEYLRVRRLF